VASVELRVRSQSDTTLELHGDSQDGTLLGKCAVSSTSNAWATQSCALGQPATGVSRLYVVFAGAVHLNWLKFQPQAGLPGTGGMGGSIDGGAGDGAGGAGGSVSSGGAAGSATGGAGGGTPNGTGGSATGGSGVGGAGGSASGRAGGSGGASVGTQAGGSGANGGAVSGGSSGTGGSSSAAGSSSGCSCGIAGTRGPSHMVLLVGLLAGMFGLRRRRLRLPVAAPCPPRFARRPLPVRRGEVTSRG
jgi:MYXO-CTERM domain-containing protein